MQINGAKILQKKIKDGTLKFVENGDKTVKTVFELTGTLFDSPVNVQAKPLKLDADNAPFIGEVLKSGSKPSDAIKELTASDPNKILYSDCSSSIALLTQMGLKSYLTSEKYNALFKDKPWYIAQDGTDPTLGPCITRFYSNKFDYNAALGTKDTPGTVHMDLIPGDMRTFYNPYFKEGSEAYRLENTLYLGDNMYFAMPLGQVSSDTLIKYLKAQSTKPETVRDIGISRRVNVPSP